MSKRAEKRALELFPVDMQMCIDSTGEPYEVDVNEQRRKYVAFGYEQAEKDKLHKVEKWLAEIHRVCDITDENGYRIELRDLTASLEKAMEEE